MLFDTYNNFVASQVPHFGEGRCDCASNVGEFRATAFSHMICFTMVSLVALGLDGMPGALFVGAPMRPANLPSCRHVSIVQRMCRRMWTPENAAPALGEHERKIILLRSAAGIRCEISTNICTCACSNYRTASWGALEVLHTVWDKRLKESHAAASAHPVSAVSV